MIFRYSKLETLFSDKGNLTESLVRKVTCLGPKGYGRGTAGEADERFIQYNRLQNYSYK